MTRFKLSWVIWLAFITMLGSCSKLNRIEVEDSITLYFGINPVEPGSYTYAEIIYLNDLAEKMEDNGSSIDKLEEVRLTGVDMKILSPSNATYDPFDQFMAYLWSETKGEVLLAAINPVPEGDNFLSFQIEPIDIADYFAEDELVVRIAGENSMSTVEGYSFEITFYLVAEASIF